MESFINNIHFFDANLYQDYQEFQAWREAQRQGNTAPPPAPPVRGTTSHPSLALVPALRQALPARPQRSSGSDEQQRPRNNASSITDSVEIMRRNKARTKDKVKVRFEDGTKGSDSGPRRSKVRSEDRKILAAGPSKTDVDSQESGKRDLRLSFEEGLEQWVKGAVVQTEQRERAGKYIRNAKEHQGSFYYQGNVDLSQLGLLSAPPQLGELHQTRNLNLSYNELLTLSSQIGKLANLTMLNVSYNRLRKLPEEIFSLRNLLELDLTKNELFDLPTGIGKLGSLRYLYVDLNRLHHLPNELSQLSKLEILSVKGNQLVDVPESIGILTELRKLDLSSNRLEELPPSWRDLFQLLRKVDLSDNSLLELPTSFKPPKGGRPIELDLSKNPISTLPPSYEGFTYSFDVTSVLPSKFPMKAKLETNNHVIENRIHRITVNTKETGIRQGLVNQSRLEAGRGIRSQEQMYAQDMVPAGRIFNNELDSIYSMEEYVREHRELGGGIVGLEHKARPEMNTGGDVNQVENWVTQGAIKYANRFNPQPEGPPPQNMDAWDSGWVEPGYGGAEAEYAAGPSYPMYGGYGAQAGYGAQPGYGAQTGLESLHPELKQVLNDELQQLAPRDAQAKMAQLRSLPTKVLQAVIVQMQNARIGGGQGTGGVGGTGGAGTSAPPPVNTTWPPEPAPWANTAGLQPRKGWLRTMKSAVKNANFLNNMFGEGS